MAAAGDRAFSDVGDLEVTIPILAGDFTRESRSLLAIEAFPPDPSRSVPISEGVSRPIIDPFETSLRTLPRDVILTGNPLRDLETLLKLVDKVNLRENDGKNIIRLFKEVSPADVRSIFVKEGEDRPIALWLITRNVVLTQAEKNEMLLLAAGNGDIRTVNVLLGLGANIRAKHPTKEYSVLSVAAGSGNIELVELLLENGLSVNEDDNGAFYYAAKYNKYSTIKMLKFLESSSVDSSWMDEAMIGSISAGKLNVVKYLVGKGIDINVIKDGTYLSSAAKYGYLDIVKYLAEHGANIHALKENALKWATEAGHLSVVKYLVEKGANFHIENEYVIKTAVFNKHFEIVKYLTHKGANINVDRGSLLAVALSNHDLATADFLISKGVTMPSYSLARW